MEPTRIEPSVVEMVPRKPRRRPPGWRLVVRLVPLGLILWLLQWGCSQMLPEGRLAGLIAMWLSAVLATFFYADVLKTFELNALLVAIVFVGLSGMGALFVYALIPEPGAQNSVARKYALVSADGKIAWQGETFSKYGLTVEKKMERAAPDQRAYPFYYLTFEIEPANFEVRTDDGAFMQKERVGPRTFRVFCVGGMSGITNCGFKVEAD